jgi:uncharacterized protein (TIGR00730 family)
MDTEHLPSAIQAALDIQHLIQHTGGSPNADLLTEFIETILRARDLERVDLKILHRAVRELRYAFSVFARYRQVRKVAVFGSARMTPDAPVYALASAFTRDIAAAGFMVITGAGDGIMKAAQEGAGREQSFGLNILLPFEQEANEIIVNDPKLVYLKYFFTRKLLFVKEAHAFVMFPGGFGTHDEAFETLTLMQTGKTELMPMVFLDVPDSRYWQDWLAFIKQHLLGNGLISPMDLHLFKVTHDVHEAVREITTFFRNYHSMRYVDGQLVLRLQHEVSAEMLATLNDDFADILTQGDITLGPPQGDDATQVPDLPRLRLWFDRVNYGRLRQLIDVINTASDSPGTPSLLNPVP